MRPQHIPDWQSDVSQLERFSRVRLIVVDLDGTFVRPSTSILFPSLRELQRSLSHPNYQVGVTVATGRAWAGAKPIIEELSISDRNVHVHLVSQSSRTAAKPQPSELPGRCNRCNRPRMGRS